MLAVNTTQIATNATRLRPQGLVMGTTVLTLDGEIPVEYLAAGDRIITRNGARKLVGITATVVKDLKVVRIMAGVLGHDAPEADVVLGSEQAILVRDWRAKALSGRASAMIEAHRSVDGQFIRAETLAQARVFTLHFDEAAVIYASALELSCPVAAPVTA